MARNRSGKKLHPPIQPHTPPPSPQETNLRGFGVEWARMAISIRVATSPGWAMMSRRLARLRVPIVWRATAAVALMIAPAGPALAASAVPHCFDSELSTVNQAFDDVALADSAMREAGDLKRSAPASNGVAGVLVSRALIEVADIYGFRWDCTTQSFVATTPTTAATTSTTMTTTTTAGPPTTSITEQAVPLHPRIHAGADPASPGHDVHNPVSTRVHRISRDRGSTHYFDDGACGSDRRRDHRQPRRRRRGPDRSSSTGGTGSPRWG